MWETFIYVSLLFSMSPGVVFVARAKKYTETTWGIAALLAFLPPIISAVIDQLFVAYLVAALFIAFQFHAPITRWLSARFGLSSGLERAVLREVEARYREKHRAELPHQALLARALGTIVRADGRFMYEDQVKPLADCLFAFVDALPRSQHPSPFTFPAVEAMNVGRTVNKMLGAFNWNDQSYALFPELCRTLQQNWTLHSKNKVPTPRFEKGERIWPQDFKGTPGQLVYTYLKGTPLFDLFQVEVPWPMPELARFEHQWVVGLQGSGKTSLLQKQILEDLQRVVDGDGSLLIIDSQGMSDGRLLSNIAKLDLFAPGGSLHDRLVIMDPNEEQPPSLSLFDVGQHSPDLSPDERKRLAISAISNIAFAISDTTETMQDMLEYVVQLAMEVPDANIRTLRDILQCKRKELSEKYGGALQNVDVDVRNYFEHSFYSGTEVTKAALVRRVAGMLRNPYFRAMYLSPRSTFHMAEDIEAGKVILINADKGTLGTEYAVTFGRYFIAQLATFMLRRRRSNKAVFCYIDECHEFIGGNTRIEEMLVQARKQRIGLVLAHQYMRQIKSESLLAAVTGCRLKFLGANEDAVALARYFRTDDPDNLAGLKNLTFAAFDRSGSLPLVNITVTPGLMEAEPRMTDSQYQVMRDDIRKRYSSGPPPAPEPPDQPPHPPQRRLTDGVSDVDYEVVERKWGDDVV